MDRTKIQLEDYIKDNRFELKRYLSSLFNHSQRFQTPQLNTRTINKSK